VFKSDVNSYLERGQLAKKVNCDFNILNLYCNNLLLIYFNIIVYIILYFNVLFSFEW